MLISAITIAITTWIVSLLRRESVSRVQRIAFLQPPTGSEPSHIVRGANGVADGGVAAGLA